MNDATKKFRIVALPAFFIVFALAMSAIVACSQGNLKNSGTALGTKYSVFIPPNAIRYEPQSNQKIVVGRPLLQESPAYPSDMADKNIPERTICLEIEIDESGEVYSSKPLYGITNCPADAQSIEQEFVTAATQAVARWRFKPTLLCTFPEDVDMNAAHNSCSSERVRAQPIAIKLAFKFTFTQSHRGPTVHTDSLQPTH